MSVAPTYTPPAYVPPAYVPPAYEGPTPANPFGGASAFDIFDAIEQAEEQRLTQRKPVAAPVPAPEPEPEVIAESVPETAAALAPELVSRAPEAEPIAKLASELMAQAAEPVTEAAPFAAAPVAEIQPEPETGPTSAPVIQPTLIGGEAEPVEKKRGWVAPLGHATREPRVSVRSSYKLLALSAPLAVAACAGSPPASPAVDGAIRLSPQAQDAQVPDYARQPYEPFSRENAVAVALREWRAWGSLVNDAAPGSDLPLDVRSDRQAGLWQRVGDYWWIGQNNYAPSSGWTGKYGSDGRAYQGEPPAWSAAFISYLMRTAGAGDRFPYSPLHATYINAAASGNAILAAQPPDLYAVQQGDLICYGRRGAQKLRFTDLPTASFFGHCDMVVGLAPGELTVIGGNVSAGVTMKHVPVTAQGMLSTSDGQPVDPRYPWFVVLHVNYDQ